MNLTGLVAILVGLCGMAQAGFVTIGNAGNVADTTSYGDVAYTYQISQHEVTGAEFGAAVAGDSRVGSSTPNSGTRPAANVTWYRAAKYCNWLTTSNAYTGAYQFSGIGTLTNVMSRAQILANGGLFYLLPTEDEWYKAAYFKTNASGYSIYANGTGIAPGIETDANYGGTGGIYSNTWAVGTGTMEQNGTYDMMGNLWEWNESAYDGTLGNMSENRVIRGGNYSSSAAQLSSSYRVAYGPTAEDSAVGFRVVAIPEPATAFSLVLGGLIITGYRRLCKSYGHF